MGAVHGGSGSAVGPARMVEHLPVSAESAGVRIRREGVHHERCYVRIYDSYMLFEITRGHFFRFGYNVYCVFASVALMPVWVSSSPRFRMWLCARCVPLRVRMSTLLSMAAFAQVCVVVNRLHVQRSTGFSVLSRLVVVVVRASVW